MVLHEYEPNGTALNVQLAACNFTMFASICFVTSGVAGAPFQVENFRP